MPTAVPCSARIASAARSPSSVCVGGIRMSTIATSGRCSRIAREQAVGVADLGDDVEAGVDEQPGDALAQEHRVVGEHEPQRHRAGRPGRGSPAPESSSFGMKPRTRLLARRGP